MRTLHPSRRSVLAMILAVALGAAAVAVASASSRSHVRNQTTGSRTSDASHTIVPARLREIFRVLRHNGATRAHSAASVPQLPVPASAIVGRAIGGVPAAQAIFSGGTHPTWTIPGASGLCLLLAPIGPNGAPATVCGPVTQAERGLLLMTEDAGHEIVIGLVPNGNSTVTATAHDGTVTKVPVVDNLFEIISGQPQSVSYSDASGSTVKFQVALGPAPTTSGPSTSQ
jgi:hypothetical protein